MRRGQSIKKSGRYWYLNREPFASLGSAVYAAGELTAADELGAMLHG